MTPSPDDRFDLCVLFSGGAGRPADEVPPEQLIADLTRVFRTRFGARRQPKFFLLDIGTARPDAVTAEVARSFAATLVLLSDDRAEALALKEWLDVLRRRGGPPAVLIVEMAQEAAEMRGVLAIDSRTVAQLWALSPAGRPQGLAAGGEAYLNRLFDLAEELDRAIKDARDPPAMTQPGWAPMPSDLSTWDREPAPSPSIPEANRSHALSTIELRERWRGDPAQAFAYAPRPAPTPFPEQPFDRPQPTPQYEAVPEARVPRAAEPSRASRRFAIWIPLAAIALAAAIYFLLKELAGAATIAAGIVKSLPPPSPSPPSGKDPVDVSAFAPGRVRAGEEALIQVFLHVPGDSAAVSARATEADAEASRRGVATLATEIARGQRVDVAIESTGLGIDEPRQNIVWNGAPTACQFLVTPTAAAGGNIGITIRIFVETVPVGSLRFMLAVARPMEAADSNPRNQGDSARRYRRAFLSYARADRAEVLRRAQGVQAAGLTFFQDVLSVEPGEEWERRLEAEIEACDLFLLFWSSNARQSKWVMRETQYALDRQRRSGGESPHLQPVIIEGPPPAEPPPHLAHLHFNDPINYAIAVESRASRPP